MSSLPPPLPPLSSVPSAAPPPPAVVKKPLSSVAIGLIGVATCVVLLGMLALGALVWLMSIGWSLFADQARSALQADAVVQEHIGHIRDMRVDLYRTSLAPGSDEFVFDMQGDRGSGRVHATWVSDGAEREILSAGVLTLRDGTEYTLPAETDAEESEMDTDTDTDTDTDFKTESAQTLER
ncbi:MULTISPECIES: hypothetical protein [Xanthomonas]|uniref:hypothetical protein n=1 Tax=Xanthomonas TaxID=338 RepID=UPI001ADA85C5|nr:hypothetical protein [Xanthomonas phaseoli]MBO9768737.1 hypothetical protein [Xanthomonas phaseoli pv. dieffenbachiae]MBO9776936.1 hypothetical protein [Xanthomonas phaseoli pv. dieffenbachiae]MBO9781835.1 hypothetical protein [Xanthomonas phaseoli pv. dieffenbachiae]MBO9797448.1 hypothetical protein [Xanthomonas phaseoli pv. dieffenbachiae]MBO9799797.1 hypothetical protein [Xanthomonas phaseoli pv. dieffenbachiae]